MSYPNNKDKTAEIFVSVALKEANLFYKDRIDATLSDVKSLAEEYLKTLLDLNSRYGASVSAPAYSNSYSSGGEGYAKREYTPRPATDKQKNLINQLLASKGLPQEEEESIRNSFSTMTTKDAANAIDKLKA